MSTPASTPPGMTLGAKIKLGAVALVAVVLVIFVLTNWDSHPLSFLGIVELSMPLGVLVLLTAAGGFAVGWTTHAVRSRRKQKADAAAKPG